MELDIENRYLKTVIGIIDRKLKHLTGGEASVRDNVLSLRQDMWEDTTHIIREFIDVVELSAHNTELNRASDSYIRVASDIKRLQAQRMTPYFGRFDFIENKADGQETIYIGTHSLTDDTSYKSFVCDWRAPVCSVFYECDLGGAVYKTPDGNADIQVVLKRQYKIENGIIVYLYDTNSHMHDDILGRVLSGNTSNRLKVIVSSIQKEQNTAIREAACRLMLIFGPAGSGKTSVGLHRMAYLLYHHRDSLRAGDIVFISSNAIFNSYISNIMPELGEDEITRFVFSDLFAEMNRKGFKTESRYMQYAALNSHEGKARLHSVKMKYSHEFLAFFIEYFKSFRFKVPELRYKDKVIVSREQLQNKWDALSFSGYKACLSNLCDHIRETYKYYFFINKTAILNDIARGHDGMISETAALYRYEVFLDRCINAAIDEVIRINGADAQTQVLEVISRYCAKKGLTDIHSNDLRMSFEDKLLLYEDALLYLFAGVLMGEIEVKNQVSHVLVDEAQDYNPLELGIIKALYPRSSFTMLADINQSVLNEASLRSLEELEQVFGKGIRKIHLRKSYRSSGPISALAFRLISKIDGNYESENSFFKREGAIPRCIITKDAPGTIANIIKDLEHYNTIGILTRDTLTAKKLYEEFKGDLKVQLIAEPSDEITHRIVILPLILSKGLEFDAVFAVGCMFCRGDNSGDETDNIRRAYLACTRALHELIIIEASPLSERFSDCGTLMKISFGPDS